MYIYLVQAASSFSVIATSSDKSKARWFSVCFIVAQICETLQLWK